jgi:predicted ATPase
MPFSRSHLARAYIELGNFEDAWRSICEAMTMIERTTEAWCEAEVYQTAGEIMLLAPERDSSKAEAYFNCAITVAGAQQAKSWELRASMSLARLWRDQGKVGEARELLATVYDYRRVRYGATSRMRRRCSKMSVKVSSSSRKRHLGTRLTTFGVVDL